MTKMHEGSVHLGGMGLRPVAMRGFANAEAAAFRTPAWRKSLPGTTVPTFLLACSVAAYTNRPDVIPGRITIPIPEIVNVLRLFARGDFTQIAADGSGDGLKVLAN